MAVHPGTSKLHGLIEDTAREYLAGESFTVANVRASAVEAYADVQTPDRAEREELPFHAVYNLESGLLGLYSNSWFERLVIRNWQNYLLPLLDHPKRAWKCNDYLEIGVCEGRSMRWVMEELKPSRAVGVDPYRAPREKQRRAFREYQIRVKKNLAPWLDAGKCELLRKSSHEWLRSSEAPEDQSFDFIYVDGDHRGHLAQTDLVLAWWKLRIGGVMVLDDFNRRWAHSQPATWEAGTGFALAFDHLFDWVYRTRKQFCLRKHHHA